MVPRACTEPCRRASWVFKEALFTSSCTPACRDSDSRCFRWSTSAEGEENRIEVGVCRGGEVRLVRECSGDGREEVEWREAVSRRAESVCSRLWSWVGSIEGTV